MNLGLYPQSGKAKTDTGFQAVLAESGGRNVQRIPRLPHDDACRLSGKRKLNIDSDRAI